MRLSPRFVRGRLGIRCSRAFEYNASRSTQALKTHRRWTPRRQAKRTCASLPTRHAGTSLDKAAKKKSRSFSEIAAEEAEHTDGGKPITIDLEDVPRANWSFSIFSPDCQRILILLSRGGPYHVVRLDHFARYAAGEPPELELRGKPDPETGTGAGNLRDGAWISNTEISYAWGCCDPPIVERVVIPRR